MFKFFQNSYWAIWAYAGSITILVSIWLQVQIDVKINYWFGEFYDLIQKALGTPNAVSLNEYFASLLTFGQFAAMWIGLSLFSSFFTSHFLFRWRASMVEYYHSVYDKARQIEGASQRVQEDTIKFSRIMETLGTSFFEAILVLFEFFPILMTISIGLPILWFGDWEYGLVVGAFAWSVGGTLFMILLAWILRLVGIEYDLQKKEAAYRKILVIAEDDGSVRPKSLNELFEGVRSIHYKSYLNYFYFNIGRLAYLQANVLSAYILIAPAIVAGVMTLGVMQQLVRAFGRVEASMQYLFNSWPTLIELASVYKRLREFEQKLENLEKEIRV